MDTDHAEWTMTAIAELALDDESVSVPARAAADAWWAFLDERDADYAGAIG